MGSASKPRTRRELGVISGTGGAESHPIVPETASGHAWNPCGGPVAFPRPRAGTAGNGDGADRVPVLGGGSRGAGLDAAPGQAWVSSHSHSPGGLSAKA